MQFEAAVKRTIPNTAEPAVSFGSKMQLHLK